MDARFAVLGLVAVSCTGAPSVPAAPEQAPPRVPEQAPPTEAEPLSVVIGVLHEAGDEHCEPKTPDNSQWVNPHYEVGFTPLKLAANVESELVDLVREPVILRGRPTTESPLETEVPHDASGCVAYQMRSDMVRTREGIRIRRNTNLPANFEPQSVTKFDGLKVTASGEKLAFALMNPLQVPLEAPLQMVLHYEGCFGKPGARQVAHSHSGVIEPGGIWRSEAPRILEDGRTYRFASVQIIYSDPKVHFDFDARLSDLGVDGVACPRD